MLGRLLEWDMLVVPTDSVTQVLGSLVLVPVVWSLSWAKCGGICGCVVRDPVVWFVIRAGTLADPYGDLRVCLFGGWNGICWWCQ